MAAIRWLDKIVRLKVAGGGGREVLSIEGALVWIWLDKKAAPMTQKRMALRQSRVDRAIKFGFLVAAISGLHALHETPTIFPAEKNELFDCTATDGGSHWEATEDD